MGFQVRHLYSIKHNLVDEAVPIFKDKAKSAKNPRVGIMADFNMTHSGMGINDRLYPQAEVMKGRRSISKKDGSSYDIPLIVNHDIQSKPLGRFRGSKYIKMRTGAKNFDWMDFATQRNNKVIGEPSGLLVGSCNILDAQTIEDVQNEVYTTTSVGMRIEDFMCTIHDKGEFHRLSIWNDETCGHWPGDVYNNILCLAIAQGITYKELSFVNAPADAESGVIEMNLGLDELLDKMAQDHQGKMQMEAMGSSPIDFYLVGDNGEVTFLDTDRYEPTSHSVDLGAAHAKNGGAPAQDDEGDSNVSGDDEGHSYGEQDFARLHVLSSLNDLGFINLTKSEAKDVAEFRTKQLSQDHVNQMEKAVKVGPGRAFPLCDNAHVKIASSLVSRYQGPGSKKSVLSEIAAAADNLGFSTKPQSPQTNKGVKMTLRKEVEDCVEVDQLQQKWNASLDSVDAKDSEISQLKTRVEELEGTVKTQDETIAKMESDRHAEHVDELIAIRKEMGRKAALETDETKAKEYRDGLLGRDPQYVLDAIEEERVLLEELKARTDQQDEIEDPTGAADNSASDSNKGGKEENATDSEGEDAQDDESFDLNKFC
jgi:TolA-binding protein